MKRNNLAQHRYKRLRMGDKRDRFSVALYATEERSHENEKLYANYFAAFQLCIMAELNDVTSRLIILINEEINEANCMISNSAKLDSMTKQHTQFGVSASHGSRDMVRTKSWRKKRKKEKKECEQNHIASPTGIANYVTSNDLA